MLLTMMLVAAAGASRADHIAVYSDATGSVCNLPAGFSANGTVIHKFSIGATSSRFKLDLSLAPGSVVFSFNTPYVPVGDLVHDISIGYGQCLTGNIVLGTIVAVFQPGAISIVSAEGYPLILYTDCLFEERPATGGHTSIAGDGHGCDYDAVETSTWGKVKSLYR
jgi:hypothetical protein